MSDVLLGHAYYLKLDPKSWAARQPYPPLGTLYAAALLRESGRDVSLFDATLADSEAEWADALRRTRPRIAVVFEDNFNYLSKMCLLRMRQAAFTMFDMARRAGCTVIAAGSDATDHAREYLAAGAHYILSGEGEQTLLELLETLSGSGATPVEEIPGLVHADRHGRIVRGPARPLLRDLDALPFPARDLLDMARYREIWLRHHGYFSLNLATTRGCPYHCNWCAKPIWGQRYNVRSPENVVGEMAALKSAWAPDHLWFADDIMGLRPGWLGRFADAVVEADVRTPFKCLSRADLLLRDGDIDALRRAGCAIVWTGAESGSQTVLDAMDKGIRVEQIREAASRLHEAGIQVGFFLQFGYPGETRADIARTFDLVRECEPDDIGVSVSYPLPGTRFHRSVEAELGARRNWVDSADLAMMYRGPFTTAFYRRLHTTLHREFRLRRMVRGARGLLRSPRSWRPVHLRSAAKLVRYVTALPMDRLRLAWLARARHAPTAVRPQTLPADQAARPSPQELA